MEARTLVARLTGDGQGYGHKIEKQVLGALTVVKDRHVASRLASMADDVAEPLATCLRRLSGAETPADRWRILNNLRVVSDDERVQSELQCRLSERDDIQKYADEHGFSVENAVCNIEWRDTDE
jgi:trehalose-6-phosphatase